LIAFARVGLGQITPGYRFSLATSTNIGDIFPKTDAIQSLWQERVYPVKTGFIFGHSAQIANPAVS